MAKATKTTTKSSAPAKKAAATSTTRKSSATATNARQAATLATREAAISGTPEKFDAKANRDLKLQERAAAKSGTAVKLTEFTVAPGRSVRKAGVRYTEGERINLSPSDSARLLSRGDVLENAAASAEAKRLAQAEADKAANDLSDPDSPASKAQRAADEQAAADKAAADAEAGRVSGPENR